MVFGDWFRWSGRPPKPSMRQNGGVEHHLNEADVGKASTIGLDLAKSVFLVQGRMGLAPLCSARGCDERKCSKQIVPN